MHFQIYIPTPEDTQLGKEELLRSVGLEDFALGANADRFAKGASPDNERGICVHWPHPGNGQFGYRPNQQTWLPAVPSPDGRPAKRYWAGLWNDSPPTPDQLARKRQYDGTPVELGDGNEWLIPSAALMPRDCRLDQDTGERRFVVSDRFRSFWDQSYEWFLDLRQQIAPTSANPEDEEDENDEIPEQPDHQKIWINADWAEYLLLALNMNYRLVREVENHLHLLNTGNMISSVYATVQDHTAYLVASE